MNGFAIYLTAGAVGGYSEMLVAWFADHADAEKFGSENYIDNGFKIVPATAVVTPSQS